MSDAILDQPASLPALRQLHRQGVIDDATFHRAASALRPPSEWLSWIRVNLLFIGSALILAGIVFFFAYNWKEMGRFQKLGLIEGGILLSVLGAWWRGVDVIAGNLFMLSASVLVGVFLAVFGQTYQTGADAYELFTGWAALIFIWVVLTRFAGLWFFWLVLVETGVVLFWYQVADKELGWSLNDLALVMAGINALALAVRELALWHGRTWLSGRWHRIILFFGILAWVTTPVLWYVIDSEAVSSWNVVAWLVTIASYVLYRKVIPDFTCVSLVAADVALVFLAWVGRRLFEGIWHSEPFGRFFIYAVIIGITTTALSIWLAKVNRAMKSDARREALPA